LFFSCYITKNKQLLREDKQCLFTNKQPGEIIKLVEDKGYKQLLIIGGGRTNSLFLKNNLINEIYLDVHPLILSQGIKLFGDEEFKIDLDLMDSQQLGSGLTLLHYKVK